MFKTHSQTATVSAQEMITQKLIMLVDDDPIFRKVTSAYSVPYTHLTLPTINWV